MVRRGPTVSERVVEAVGARTDTNPLGLPLLFETLDPDALNSLVREMAHGELTFHYAGRAVAVESSGAVRIDSPVAARGAAGVAGERVD